MRGFRLAKVTAALVAVTGFSVLVVAASPARAADLANGKKVYADKCAACHGAGGKGDGRVAQALGTKPWNFTDGKKMGEFTDAEMRKAVLDGKPPMPGYKGKMSDKDVDDAIAYIRAFAGQ